MSTPDESCRIFTGAVRVGQQVSIYAFPAGRFGEWEDHDGERRHLGEQRTGMVACVEEIECPSSHDEHGWMPGRRVTFEDGTTWDGVDHALATWLGGVEPALADVKAASAAESEMHTHNEAMSAAYAAEGEFAEFHLHPVMDFNGEEMVAVHTPWEVEGDEPMMVTPEQAEAFALRLLREAQVVRLLRSGMVEVSDDCDDPTHTHG